MSIPVQPQRANFKGVRPFHPLADILPLMEGEEFEQFATSIRESGGPREPIVIYEDKILDGRNRARACQVAGIEPQYTHLPSGTDPVAFVIDKNLRRRHLNESQRAMAAARLATMSQGARTDLSPIGERSQAEAAHLLNVGKRSVERATKVHKNGVSELQKAVECGEITISAAEKIARLPRDQQVAALPNGNRAIRASRQESIDSLDFFPTGPWATRALIETVFPALNISQASLRDVAVWEPACGEGHMAEVLAEYFGDVHAPDIHDYGYGAVNNFLQSLNNSASFEWIITNPPFGDKSESFVLRALGLAAVGVAMFFRLQWLETSGRYERIFKDHPPTLIALFAERVPLHRGCWKPDGDTATAYCWLIWIKDRSPRAPFWIPPGQREALTRPDDIDRFTAHPVIKKQYLPPVECDGHSIPLVPSVPAALPTDDGLDIPNFLRIGHSECTWRSPE